MILNKILFNNPKKFSNFWKNTWNMEGPLKIPGIWMTPKKYIWLKILPPKNSASLPVGLRVECPPLGFSFTSIGILYIYKDDTQILVNGNQILYSVNSLGH